jgi:hypothetical protein
MPKLTKLEKLEEVRKQAFQRGLKIKADPRLTCTPYCAMNEHAAKELKQPYIKDTLTYSPETKDVDKIAMDLNHEIHEADRMEQGWKYKAAHKYANRKQRTFKKD